LRLDIGQNITPDMHLVNVEITNRGKTPCEVKTICVANKKRDGVVSDPLDIVISEPLGKKYLLVGDSVKCHFLALALVSISGETSTLLRTLKRRRSYLQVTVSRAGTRTSQRIRFNPKRNILS